MPHRVACNCSSSISLSTVVQTRVFLLDGRSDCSICVEVCDFSENLTRTCGHAAPALSGIVGISELPYLATLLVNGGARGPSDPRHFSMLFLTTGQSLFQSHLNGKRSRLWLYRSTAFNRGSNIVKCPQLARTSRGSSLDRIAAALAEIRRYHMHQIGYCNFFTASSRLIPFKCTTCHGGTFSPLDRKYPDM